MFTNAQFRLKYNQSMWQSKGRKQQSILPSSKCSPWNLIKNDEVDVAIPFVSYISIPQNALDSNQIIQYADMLDSSGYRYRK